MQIETLIFAYNSMAIFSKKKEDHTSSHDLLFHQESIPNIIF